MFQDLIGLPYNTSIPELKRSLTSTKQSPSKRPLFDYVMQTLKKIFFYRSM